VTERQLLAKKAELVQLRGDMVALRGLMVKCPTAALDAGYFATKRQLEQLQREEGDLDKALAITRRLIAKYVAVAAGTKMRCWKCYSILALPPPTLPLETLTKPLPPLTEKEKKIREWAKIT
jgi:hypothetical protein